MLHLILVKDGGALKITFIRVNMFDGTGSDAMKPLIFGIIKNLTPTEFEIDFIDERAEKLPEKIDSDIIAFSVETFAAKRAYRLAKRYKTDKNIIVMGGFHAAAMPDEMLEYSDSVIIGDAEGSWREFLADCKNGAPKRKYISDENAAISELCTDDSIYKRKYYGIGVYQISRGCKFSCGFCSIKTMYKCVRRKNADTVARELSQMKEKIIFFADDNLFYNRDTAVELLEKIAPLKKKWACQISMDAARDDELLSKMKNAGCFLTLIGFESLNAESLAEMHKSANTSRDYEDVIRRLYRHKMLVYGTFVLGCDGDGPDVFGKTFKFAVRSKISVANFNPLIPMPATDVYEKMESQGRLRYKKWWLSDSYRYGETAFMPKNMSPEQLRDGCLKIRKNFYSVRCILKRLFANPINFIPVNFLVFILANFISRREISKKQGQPLGM